MCNKFLYSIFACPQPEELEQLIKNLEPPLQSYEVVALTELDLVLEKNKSSHLFLECGEELNGLLLDDLHLRFPEVKITIMHQGQFHVHLNVFRERPWLKNFISCMPKLQIHDLQTVVHKLSSPCIFGLKQYFPKDTDLHSVTISDSHLKNDYIDEILDRLKEHLTPSTNARLGNILEEMMMNVLWDAPRDEHGEPLYNHVSRRTRIQLTPEQAGTVTVGLHGKQLGISCSDPFGAITLNKIIQYLNKCYYSEQQIGSEGAGAGLGLYMIYNLSENFTINVEKGKRTEFILLFKTHNALKKKHRPKSFHYYERSNHE
jgi:hypothetical protein